MSVERILNGLKKVRRVGEGWVACCPAHDDKGPSLSISQGVDDRPLIYCHAGCSQEAVINELKTMGLWMSQTKNNHLPQQASSESSTGSTDKSKEKCLAIWKQTLDTHQEEAGPLGTYIRTRGLNTENLPDSIRFHPNLPYYENGKKVGFYPALVAQVLGVDGGGMGLQRIYLTTDGQKADVSEAKKAIGKLRGGAIRLDDPTDTLALAEGLETALAVRQATDLPTWAAVSAAGLERVEIPKSVTTVHIYGDKDQNESGQKAAYKTADRLHRDGKTVYVHFPPSPIEEDAKGKDWLDVLNVEGPDALEATLAEAQPWEPVRKPNTDEKKRTQAQLLIELAGNVELFTTPELDCYATLPNDGHAETWPIKSKAFRRWMTRRFYETESKPPGAQALQDALNLLEAKAQFQGPTCPMNTRLAWHKGNLYIDLADERWRVVEVTPSGWRVVSASPVKFRRTAGMMPLPEPVKGGSIDELRSLVNFGSESDWKLIVSWLVAALRPDGPYPVLTLYGEQGSAKSSQELLLRSLIDPSSAPLRTAPRNERDLMIAARNGWIIALDNLSGLPNWLSDGLCRLATGGGFTTRRLYTDDEEEIFDAQRPVILNGITIIATRADLVDRSINIDLPQIPDEKRRPEKEIHAEFERVRPQVLGALLDAVSAGLKNYSQVTLESLPRMADFAKWIVACEPALGWECGEFMKVYTKNRESLIEGTLEADPLASALRLFMEGKEGWEGQPSQLLHELEEIVDERTKKSKAWPGSPNWLTQKLKRPATFLRSVGIDIRFPGEGRGKKRQITIIRKGTQNSDDVVDTEVSSLTSHENKELNTADPKIATPGKPSTSRSFNGNVGIDDKNPTHSSPGEQVDRSTVSEAKDRVADGIEGYVEEEVTMEGWEVFE